MTHIHDILRATGPARPNRRRHTLPRIVAGNLAWLTLGILLGLCL